MRGFGTPFNYRSVDWCSSQYATELRCLNALGSDMTLFFLKIFESVLEKSTGSTNLAEYTEFINQMKITVSPSIHVNELLAFMIKKKVVKFGDVKRMFKRLVKSYKLLKDEVMKQEEVL